MKKSNLIKIFSIIIMSVMVILFSTSVLAADSLDDLDDFESLPLDSGNTNLGNTNPGNTNPGNSNISNTNTNNSSTYTNTNLPKTGIGDAVPVAILVVVFGISSIYAYKKIKEYRNI